MSAETLTLALPSSLAEEVASATQELLERGLREMRIERALERYSRGGMSFGAVAREGGISQSELARQGYARGIDPPFSPEMLVEELSRASWHPRSDNSCPAPI